MFKKKIKEFLWQEKHIRDRMCRIGNTDRSGKCPDETHETSQKKEPGWRDILEFKKENMKNCMYLILFTVLLYVGLQNLDVVLDFLMRIVGLFFPFLVGCGIAFVLNVPMQFIERNVFGRGKWKNTKLVRKIARPVSLVLAILVAAFVIFIVGNVVVPELGRTVMGLGRNIERGITNITIWIDENFKQDSAIAEWDNSLEIEPQKMLDSVMTGLQRGVNNILSSTVTVTLGIVNTAMNFGIGFVFACYVLLQKEKLMVQIKKALYALFPKKAVKYVLHVCSLANDIFSGFVTGQCIEAVILGTMFFVTMTIFRFPYAMLVGVLIAFTALIPVFGAFIGCAVSFILIFLISPVQALLFLILFFVLQQIEGNLIYPHVVGGSVGLPSVWVLMAVTIGGSLMGVVGMLIFIPLVSVLYALFREWMYKRLKSRNIQIKD